MKNAKESYYMINTFFSHNSIDVADTQGTYCSVDENGYSVCVANEFGL